MPPEIVANEIITKPHSRIISPSKTVTSPHKILAKDMEDLIHLQGPLTEDAVMRTLQARFNERKYFVSKRFFPFLLQITNYKLQIPFESLMELYWFLIIAFPLWTFSIRLLFFFGENMKIHSLAVLLSVILFLFLLLFFGDCLSYISTHTNCNYHELAWFSNGPPSLMIALLIVVCIEQKPIHSQISCTDSWIYDANVGLHRAQSAYLIWS